MDADRPPRLSAAPTAEDDAARRLRWGLGRWFWVPLLGLTIGLVLAMATGSDGRAAATYRAEALVVAQALTLRQEQLPRFGQAVFTSGAVAEAVAAQAGDGATPREMVPGRIAVEPIPDTIGFVVVGRAAEPVRATELANAAAEAFVHELNKPGPGVGTFAVQDMARVPDRPEPASGGGAARVTMALVAGAAFGVGGVGLLLALRRPVLTPHEAARVAGVPVLGVLQLPRWSRRGIDGSGPAGLEGLAAAAQRLLPQAGSVCVLVSGRGEDVDRSVVAAGLAAHASRSAPVALVTEAGSPAFRSFPSSRPHPNLEIVVDGPLTGRSGGRRLVVDGLSLAEGACLGAATASPAVRVALVVPEGLPLADLEEAAANFLPGELDGMLFVRRPHLAGAA